MHASIEMQDHNFLLRIPYDENWMAKGAPDRTWDRVRKVWVLPANMANAEYIRDTFNSNVLSHPAKEAVNDLCSRRSTMVAETPFPDWYEFPPPPFAPMEHQRAALDKAWNKYEFAIYHEMGLGKTYSAVSLACAYHLSGDIDGVLVVCPTAIKPVWRKEFRQFRSPVIPDEKLSISVVGMTSEPPTEKGLDVLVVGIESLSQGKARLIAREFVESRRCLMIVDESSTIKNFGYVDKHGKVRGVRRTAQCMTLGENCVRRLIMTGTPITQGIQDIYSQFAFLNWEIVSQKSYFAFRNRYCIMGGFEARQIVGYQNVKELMNRVAPFVHRALKADALDLPPKVYEERILTPAKWQVAYTKTLKDEMAIVQGDEVHEIENTLERLLRYQQIAGGLMPAVSGEDNFGRPVWSVSPTDPNPKRDELVRIVEDEIPARAKVIIWARYVAEINLIREALEKKYGIGCTLEFTGRIPGEDRAKATEMFQEDPSFRFMVSNQQTGGMGQTWTAATYVIYWSNSFSYQDRVQSEDRAHRKGQENKVTYIDLRVKLPVEALLRKSLGNKGSMAEFVSDRLRGVDDYDDWD